MNSHAILPLNQLSPVRISAASTTLGLHLIVFAMLVLPPQALIVAPRVTPPEALIVQEIVAEVVREPEPVPPIPNPPVRPQPRPRDLPRPDTVPIILAESAIAVPVTPLDIDTTDSAETDPGPSPVSRAAQIAYDLASSPPYPSLAVRRGWEGLVLLRVRVDEQGRPREVQIERSSGHGVLDRSASAHVLAHWRFQPALQDGRAVTAWARVPVNFKLQHG